MKKLSSLFMLVFMFCLQTYGQTLNIKGSVTEAGSGEPLIGATVAVKGSQQGTVTDIDGNFVLNNVNSNATLTVSYVGYIAADVKVNGRSDIKIELKADNQVLNEVVVIGYGTMDKKELTSAISHVSEKDFLNVTAMDPSMMIQGKVPGVSITNTGAGDPNNGASIQIRGVSSVRQVSVHLS